MHGLDLEQHLGGGVGDRLAVEACHGRILTFLSGRLEPVWGGNQAMAADGTWRSGSDPVEQMSTAFDARVGRDFTRLTRRGRARPKRETAVCCRNSLVIPRLAEQSVQI